MSKKQASRYAGYSLHSFRKDLLAGIVVGVIAIPLGMGFAIASGVKPEYGIYTTIIAGILISLLGGSRFQIGGPTGAFVPVLLGIVMTYGYNNLLVAGILAGIMLFLMGVFKLGSLIQYIPQSVTIGFTSGIAVTIFTGQIGNFFGLTNMEKHETFLANMKEIVTHLYTWNWYSVAVALISLAIILVMGKLAPKVPGALIGLVVSSVIAAIFFPDKVATIGSTYGDIPSKLPAFRLPDMNLDTWVNMIRPAFVIAMLGGIESLLSAVVADGMTQDRHNSNRELRAQGIANIITPLFGGIPATGAIARTATNIKGGAVSPISGIVHGIVVLLILVVFAPYASSIPLAAMAPVLMLVAWNMSERKTFAHVLGTRSGDSVVLLVTFFLTVFVNLTVAVEVGLLSAVVLFAKRMSDTLQVKKVLPNHDDEDHKMVSSVVMEHHDCPQITIYSVNGPLFFGATRLFNQMIDEAVKHQAKFVLVRMRSVPYMDMTGVTILSNGLKRLQKQNAQLLVTGLQAQPEMLLQRAGVYDKIGKSHFFDRTGDAIHYATARLDNRRCAACQQFAFQECGQLVTAESGNKEKDA